MINFLRNKTWIVYIPIILVPFLLFGIPLLSGKVLYWGTPALQFVPWREYAYLQLEQGTFPLWNPLNGMGAPLAANYQLAFFYPPGWILILGHWISGAPGVAWVYTLLVPVHLAWAGIGMVVLLRSIGICRLGQILLGMAFCLSGYFVARAGFFSMIWTGIWLPWVLWAASNIGSPFSNHGFPKNKFWFVLFVAMLLLAGHAQLSWYILLFTVFWVIIGAWFTYGFKKAVLAGCIVVGLILCAVVIAGIQLIPTMEYMLQSQRATAYEYTQAMTYSFWPWRFLTFLNPELFGNPGIGDYWGYAAYWEDAVYIGIIPLFLALRTIWLLFRSKEKSFRKGIVFLWIMTAIGCVFALGANTPVFPWLYKNIPSFNLFQAPARWMIWPVISLSLLAGISIQTWNRPEGRLRRNANLMTAGFAAVFIGAGIASAILPELKPGLVRGFIIFAGLGLAYGLLVLSMPASEGDRKFIWSVGVVLVLTLDLIGANVFLNPFVSSNFYKPQIVANPAIASNKHDGRIFISSKDEYDLKFNKYLRFEDTRYSCDFIDIRNDYLPNLNLLDGIASVNNFDPFVPARFASWMDEVNRQDLDVREKFLKFMGVSSVVQLEPSGGTSFTTIADKSDEMVKGFFCAKYVESPQEALLATIKKIEEGDEPEQCIILETTSPDAKLSTVTSVGITNFEQGNDYVKFSVNTGGTVWLRIASTWFPGWKASIDGIDVPVLRADYIFSVISVSQGQHEVLIYYRPVSFVVGTIASVIGLCLLALIGIMSFRKKDRH